MSGFPLTDCSPVCFSPRWRPKSRGLPSPIFSMRAPFRLRFFIVGWVIRCLRVLFLAKRWIRHRVRYLVYHEHWGASHFVFSGSVRGLNPASAPLFFINKLRAVGSDRPWDFLACIQNSGRSLKKPMMLLCVTKLQVPEHQSHCNISWFPNN